MSVQKEKIENLITRLEREIKAAQADIHASERLEKLKNVAKIYRGEDQVISFDVIAESIRNEPEEYKIFTGWTKIDELIKGFRLQQLVVISAATKSGKTSFLMDLTARIPAENVLWLPFEESAEELIRKYIERGIAHPHGFTPSVMKGGELEWIETKIIEAIVKYDTKVVVIDQLDFIVPLGADNHALRVGEAMRALKNLAKKWNVVIFIICHLVKTKMDTSPTMEDLKGSSSIGQEADTVILIWREAKREKGQMTITNNTIVSVQANRRHGSTGNVTMVYNEGRFLEQEWREEVIASARAEEDFNSM